MSGKTIFRYSENNTNAAVAAKTSYGVVDLGFPFEAVKEQAERDRLMLQILNYLK